MKFTWVATYKEIAQKLLGYEYRQSELISILKDIDIDRFQDIDINGPCDLDEIDPFTFLSYLNKYKDEKRLSYLCALHKRLQLNSNLPSDVEGLPTSHPMKVWLFPHKVYRLGTEIPMLWQLFKQSVNHSIEDITLNEVLKIKSVGKGKLSICWFYVDPDYYLPLDSQTSNYLRKKRLKYVYNNVEEYEEIRRSTIDKLKKKPYEISFDAFNDSRSSSPEKITPNTKDTERQNKAYGAIGSVESLMRRIFEQSQMTDDNLTFYYRGHSSKSYELKPGIYRSTARIEREHTMFKELESTLPAEFYNCKSTFDRLVKMQHYELPTRLLDLTANPLVALYFACSGQERKNEVGSFYIFPKYDDSNLSKYADSDAVSVVSNIARRTNTFEIDSIRNLDCDSFNKNPEIDFLLHEIRCCDNKMHFRPSIDPEDIERVFFVKPKMDNPRILKQDGAFFLFGIKGMKSQCPEICDYFPYIEYEIPAKDKDKILKQLDILGINEASLFPEIDHVARFIKNKYSYY